MRYAYGVTTALLLAGSALTLTTGFPAGAQVAQNDSAQMQSVVPRGGAPASFADLTQQLQPAVVNISTRQRVQMPSFSPFAGTPFERSSSEVGLGRRPAADPRGAVARFRLPPVSADGYIVTNNHVITADGQGKVEINHGHPAPMATEYPATLVGQRSRLGPSGPQDQRRASSCPFVNLRRFHAHVRVGDWVHRDR